MDYFQIILLFVFLFSCAQCEKSKFAQDFEEDLFKILFDATNVNNYTALSTTKITPKKFETARIKDDLKKFNKDKKFASANELAVYQFSILDKAMEYGCDKIEKFFNGMRTKIEAQKTSQDNHDAIEKTENQEIMIEIFELMLMTACGNKPLLNATALMETMKVKPTEIQYDAAKIPVRFTNTGNIHFNFGEPCKP